MWRLLSDRKLELKRSTSTFFRMVSPDNPVWDNPQNDNVNHQILVEIMSSMLRLWYREAVRTMDNVPIVFPNRFEWVVCGGLSVDTRMRITENNTYFDLLTKTYIFSASLCSVHRQILLICSFVRCSWWLLFIYLIRSFLCR